MLKRFVILLSFALHSSLLMSATLKVQVVDHQQKALDKVSTKLVNLKSGDEATPKTYKKGVATFVDVDTGDYQVFAILGEHRSAKSSMLSISEKDVNLTLVLPSEEEYQKVERAGNAAFEQQNYEEAQALYEKALSWSPWDSGMGYNLSRVYVRQGDSNKARGVARNISKYEIKEPEKIEQEVMAGVNFEEGRMALEKRDFGKAISSMKEALKAEPDNADACHALALAYGHLGNYPEAIKNINEALRLRPGDANFKQVKGLLEHNAEIASQKK